MGAGRKEWPREVAVAAVAGSGSLGAAAWALQLWKADLAIPFQYGGDMLFTSAFVKGLVEQGSFVHNSAIGAPGTGTLLDFPTTDAAHLLLVRLFGWLTGSWATAINIYFLLGFVLAGITAAMVMRALGASRVPAIACAILYAVLPAHFIRGEGQVFLGAYWVVPLAVLVCVWLGQPASLVFGDQHSWRPEWRNRRSLAAAAICLLIGASGVYHAFFACFLILVAGIAGALRTRDRRRVVAALVLVAFVCLSLGLGLVESIHYRLEEGPNEEVAQRWVGDSIRYALRLPQLVMPVTGHRVPALAEVKQKYHSVLGDLSPDSDNENDASSLGIVLGLGFVALIGVALWGRRALRDSTVQMLADLNLAAFLLATVDGFGAVFAMLISPQIRAYNRISVFIAFFSAALVAIALTALVRRLRPRPIARMGAYAICGLILVFGVFDQTAPHYVPAYGAVQSAYAADARFVDSIEQTLPEGAMVLQLPHVVFPESGPVVQLPDYEHFRGYLHSETTRWSYGSMRGRETDRWLRGVSELAPPELVDEAAAAGFDGIWVDARGYEDGGAAIVAGLTGTLHEEPVLSDDGRVAFFVLP